jgi:hypothetical protein
VKREGGGEGKRGEGGEEKEGWGKRVKRVKEVEQQ